MHYFYAVSIRVMLIGFLVGCGDESTAFRTEQTNPTRQDSEKNSSDKRKNNRVDWPEQDMKSDGDDNAIEKIDLGNKTIVGSKKWENVFWLNFDGATVSSEESFIIANAGLVNHQIAPFNARDISSTKSVDELKQIILSELKKHFEGINLRFTIDKPKETSLFSTVHIGGKNFTSKPGILGRAPLDFDNFNPNDILYVFAEEFSSNIEGEALTLLVHTIAHEMAHSLGLRHIHNEAAIMNPSITLATNHFNEEGTYIEADGSENSFEVLLQNVGIQDMPELENTLPDIQYLGAKSQGNIGQFSVFEFRNILENPNHRLGDFNYEWKFKNFDPVSGPSIRIAFKDSKNHKIRLKVSLGEKSKEFTFQVRNPSLK